MGAPTAAMIELSRIDAGYKPEQVLSLRVTPSRERYQRPEDLVAVTTRVVTAMREQPGVSVVALAAAVPLGEDGRMSHGMLIQGRSVGPNEVAPQAEMQIVSGEYFTTIGVPIMPSSRVPAGLTAKWNPVRRSW